MRFRGRRYPGGSRPKPLRVVVVNGMSASNVHESRSLSILAAATSRADLILGCEFANLTVDDPLDPHVWDVAHDPTSADRAGSLMAIRRTRGRIIAPRWRVGVRRGLGIRTRWLIVARLRIDPGTPHEWRPKVIAGHAPPMRAWAKWPTFIANVARRNPDIAGADFNKLARAVAPALGRKTRMVHILGLAVRRSIPATEPVGLDVGGDHEAVHVTLYQTR